MARQKIVTTTFLYLLAIIALVSFIFPFVLLIINSFKTNGEILTSPFALPENWNFAHFADVINMMNFGVTFRNSFIVTTLSTLFIAFSLPWRRTIL